jgi:hypothetical protein
MQGNFLKNKHTEQDKAAEISPLVGGQPYYHAEKDKCPTTTVSENKKQ